MSTMLEDVLKKLLVPETSVLQQATQELKHAFKDPSIIVTLCEVLCSSSDPQIRQYAAVLMRRKIGKKRQWNKMSLEIRRGIKDNILKSLHEEQQKSVKHAVAQLASTVAKFELPKNSWPELLHYLQSSITSTQYENREVGVFVLSIVATTAAEQLQPHLKGLLTMLSKTLQDHSSVAIPFYTIKTLTALTFMVGSDEMHLYQNMLPQVLQVIKQLVATDEEKACESLQIFDELIECAVSVLAPHVKTVVELCLQIGGNNMLGDEIRVKAITLISWLARLKKKAILKHKLVNPILRVLFPVMCTPVDEDRINEDLLLEEAEANTPTAVSAQVIDILALHLPPEKLLQPLMHHIESAVISVDVFYRKAAYIALAVTAEGCADYIRTKYLSSYVQCICNGIVDSHPVVHNAALYALGQFSEHLQPDIAKYAEEILPRLFECLKHTCQQLQEGKKDQPSTTKMFYALENFCESLEEGLIQYLPDIMEQLFLALNSSSFHVQELAISAIGATANAVKRGIAPYFDQIITRLIFFLTQSRSEETSPVQIQCLATLGILARVIGTDGFGPLVPECVRLGLMLLDEVDDPDMRRTTYDLFASISTILKEEMAPYLSSVIPHMMNSLISEEGVVVRSCSDVDGSQTFPLFDDLSDDDDKDDDTEEDLGVEDDDETDDDEDDGVGYSVENAYLDEKEDTCCSLREIACNTRSAFLPYLEKASEKVYRLMDHPASSVRAAAIGAMGQFCCTVHHSLHLSSPEDITKNERLEALRKMIAALLPKLTVIIHEDKERTVAMSALEVINDLVKTLGNMLLEGNGHLAAIVAVIKDVMQSKVACQDQADGDSIDDISDDQQAEHDAMLIEYAGEIVPSLAKVIPGQQFAPYFAGILAIFLPKKRNYTVAEKSFCIGILAESVNAMGESIIPFVTHLYPLFISAAQDEDEEVRSNAIFGLGVLAEFGRDAIFHCYPTILQLLSNNLGKETDPRAIDNICGAVARMITTNIQAVPIDQVFPVLIGYLPLRQDFDENKTIIKCLMYLFSQKHSQVLSKMSTILEILARISHTDQVNEETQSLLDQLICDINNNLNSDFQVALNSLSPELIKKLQLHATS